MVMYDRTFGQIDGPVGPPDRRCHTATVRQRTGSKAGASSPISDRAELRSRRKPAGATRFYARRLGRALPLSYAATVRVRGEHLPPTTTRSNRAKRNTPFAQFE